MFSINSAIVYNDAVSGEILDPVPVATRASPMHQFHPPVSLFREASHASSGGGRSPVSFCLC